MINFDDLPWFTYETGWLFHIFHSYVKQPEGSRGYVISSFNQSTSQGWSIWPIPISMKGYWQHLPTLAGTCRHLPMSCHLCLVARDRVWFTDVDSNYKWVCLKVVHPQIWWFVINLWIKHIWQCHFGVPDFQTHMSDMSDVNHQELVPLLGVLGDTCRKDLPLWALRGDSIRPWPVPCGASSKKLSKVRFDPAHLITRGGSCDEKEKSLKSFRTWAESCEAIPWILAGPGTDVHLASKRIGNLEDAARKKARTPYNVPSRKQN